MAIVRGRVTATKVTGRVVLNVVLYAGAAICMFPFLWMLSTALKPEQQALTNKFFVGFHLTWSNFTTAWDFFPFGQFMINSAIMSIGGVIVVVVTSTTAGYAFARLRFPGREKIFFAYIATLLVPSSVTVIPLFLISRALGIYDSYLGLILPISFTAFGTFLLRQFFRTLPGELADSARVDGAGEVRIFASIMLPLIKPAVAVLAVFTFIGNWGNFLWPLIVTQSQDKATIELGLSLFQGEYGSYWSYMMAGSAIAILPTMIIVIALQKYLVKGLTFSAFGGR
jgi:multiple sugar transport system permease protein